MIERKLVSVITPTWQRHDLLLGAIENVRQQSYRPLEHVIISDGLDDDLCQLVYNADEAHRAECFDGSPGNAERYVPIMHQELGRNWSTLLPSSFCAAPLTVGMLLALGDYQTWLADDERMSVLHVEQLVSALEAKGADFAYSQVEMYRADDTVRRWVIGTDPPTCGQITNCLYRWELLTRGLYPFRAGWTSDWACISRWIEAGATWAFVPRVSLTHRADH